MAYTAPAGDEADFSFATAYTAPAGDGADFNFTDADPVTDADFLEWLSLPYRRCVLAEFSAVGYDAVGSPSGPKTVNVYISNMAFDSHSTDTPPSQAYDAWIEKVPNFHRELGLALSGSVEAGFGSLIVKNPAQATNGPGVRDDWLRMRWKRDYVTLYLGDPSWRKSDFRVLLKGRLGQPTAPSMGQIAFPLADLSDLFNGLIQTNKFESGPLEGRYKPLAIGAPAWVDLPVLDDATFKFQLHDGVVEGWDESTGDGFFQPGLYDNGIPMQSVGQQGQADPGADTLSLTGSPTPGHGFSEDSTFAISSGSAPGGLDTYKRYYIVNPTATTWQVSLTRGGSAIDITADNGAFTFVVLPWWIDYATAVLTLTTQPATPRITAHPIQQQGNPFYVGFDQTAGNVANMLEYAMFTKGGISTDYRDGDSFDDLETALDGLYAGLWVSGRDQTTIRDVVERISKGTFTWYGVKPEGLIHVGLLDLPSATSVMDFIASNVKKDSLRLTSVIRPVDFTQSDVTILPPNLDNGPLLVTNSEIGYAIEKTFLPNYTYSAGSTPLDEHPEIIDAQLPKTFDTIYNNSGIQAHLVNLYKKAIGVFEFQTTLRAFLLNIGDTISLDHPRLGWKTYDAGDPQSPDNAAEFDATKAVVIGIDVNLAADDAFHVKLTVFRQIPGYYPTEDLN